MPGRLHINRNKYRAQRTTAADGTRHDSKKEANRWAELQLLVAAGQISQLRRQVPFPLLVREVLVGTYIADAEYLENGQRVVEDTKSPATRKNGVYRLKKKLLLALYGIAIREV